MKIVIIGGGKIGFSLAEELANENHDIVLVDNDKEKVKMISETLDVMTLYGNGAAIETQREANVDEETVSAVGCFAVAYFLALVLTSVILSLDGLDFGKGVVVAISSIGNIGYGLDANTCTYGISGLSILSKVTLCFDMFLGRLEIFPLLIMFAPATWSQ